MNSREAIDHVQRLLAYMGLGGDVIRRQGDNRLSVSRKIPSTSKSYRLFVWIEDADAVTFESLAFKTAYGDMDNELFFYQQVLYCNSLLDAVNFRMTQMRNEREWGIMIGANIYSDELTPGKIKRTVQSFDQAYLTIVPTLKKQATSMGLQFSGEIRRILPEQSTFGLINEGNEDDD